MLESGLQKIATNCEIIKLIYKNLEFEDQLRLSQVNKELKKTFQTHISMENYEHLRVIYHQTFNYVVTNRSGVKRRCLKPSEFEEFIKVYGSQVFELNLISCYLEMEIFTHEVVEDLVDMREFPNIVKLKLNGMEVSSKFWEILSVCCNQLEEITLEYCSNDQGGILQIASDIKLEILEKFPKLNAFSLKNYEWYLPTIEYNKWLELLRKLQLKTLCLNDRIIHETTITEGQIGTNCLKKMQIKTSLDNFPKFINHMENLTTLRLQVLETINYQMLQIIAATCPSLEIFEIANSKFDKVANIVLPKNIKEFALLECTGLSIHHLKKILQNNMKKLTFISTEYDDDESTEHFHISTKLQSLKLDCHYMLKLEEISNLLQNGHIKELIWHHSQQDCHISEEITLHCYDQLTSLQNLTIVDHHFSSGNWSQILKILNHPTLEELSMMQSSVEYNRNINPESMPNYNIPLEGDFQTNIKRLSIPLQIFEINLDFWLELFANSCNMATLICTLTFEDFDYDQCLRKLLHHKYFPKNLKEIDIFGYAIDSKLVIQNQYTAKQ
ncbi:uncharacterized protein isoform X2 [Musca autumnalis]|uniref:uncharacterized protein isoform X2 n=1 Tax=Musca autumnalis TaxID=221902 RepID=UPI003CEFA8AA